jgi:hypothetical protein
MVTPLNLSERRFEGPLAQRPTAAESSMGVTLYWLGQAGFIIQAGAKRLTIDPYLSDTLAEKYRGTATPHERRVCLTFRAESASGEATFGLVTVRRLRDRTSRA